MSIKHHLETTCGAALFVRDAMRFGCATGPERLREESRQSARRAVLTGFNSARALESMAPGTKAAIQARRFAKHAARYFNA